MSKEEIIKKIQEMPDNIDAFITRNGYYNEIDIKIFPEPKDKEFMILILECKYIL